MQRSPFAPGPSTQIGLTTAGRFLDLLPPVGRLIAVEPLPEMCQVLAVRVPEAEVTPGWNGVEALAERWRTPANMGKTVDQLSVPPAPTFGGVETEELVGVALPAHTPVAIFHDEAAGTVILLAVLRYGRAGPGGPQVLGVLVTIMAVQWPWFQKQSSDVKRRLAV